jgi:malate permease and related proteins
MYTQLLPIIIPMLVCVAVGYGWARTSFPFEREFLTRMVMNVGAPCLVFDGLTTLSSSPTEFYRSAAIAGWLIGFCFVAGALLLKLAKQPVRSYVPAVMFGNMVPLCAFAFGDEGLGLVIGFYIAASVIQFVVGPMLQGRQAAWRTLLTTPIVYSALLGLLLLQTEAAIPLAVANTVSLIGGITLPLMLIAMGYSLATFKVARLNTAIGITVLRFSLGMTAGLLAIWALQLEGVIRGVVLIEACMPVAVFNFLFAARYDRAPEDVAGAILVSTVLSFLTLPWLLLWALV